jgi:hypothetical protein
MMTLYIGVNFIFVAVYVLLNKSQVFFVLGAIIKNVFLSPPLRARQLCHTASLYPPGYPLTTAMLRITIKNVTVSALW